MLPPAMVLPFTPPSSGEFVVYPGAGLLRGWAFQNDADPAGSALVIYDGPASAGVVIAPITLSENESTRDYPPGNGLAVRTSLVVESTGGDFIGSLWFTPLTHADDIDFAFGERGPFYLRPGA